MSPPPVSEFKGQRLYLNGVWLLLEEKERECQERRGDERREIGREGSQGDERKTGSARRGGAKVRR